MKSLSRSLLFVAGCLLAACGATTDEPGQSPTTPPDDKQPPPEEIVPKVDYLIIHSDQLSKSAEAWAEYRRSKGHLTEVKTVSKIIGDTDPAEVTTKMRDFVKKRYDVRDPGKPFFVLLLGDATADGPLDGSEVPAGEYVEGFDQSKVVTDNLYADMDGDHIPDIALGRVAVETAAEADLVLAKTKKYESTYEVGTWNRRFNLFASTGGFGAEVDTQIESLVFEIIEEIPYDYEATMTYAKQTSPYVYVPEKFSDKVYERMNEGSLMMAYLGHGDERGFATLSWNGASFPILDTKPITSKIDVAHKPPLLTLIACLTGKFTSGESVSEQILKTKTGPVAVLSSTEISHPYANALFIRELAHSMTIDKKKTAGEAFIDAKRRTITNNDALRKKIEGLIGFLIDIKEREALRRSHLYMYELFGDPALTIAYPQNQATVTLSAPDAATGAEIKITAKLPNVTKGQAIVTLESRRSNVTGTLKPVPADGDATRDAIISENYTAANDHAVAKKTVQHEGGTFETTLTVPASLAAGDYFVRVIGDDGKNEAVGSAKVSVHAP